MRRLWRAVWRLTLALLSVIMMYGLAAWILGSLSTQASSQFVHDTEPCNDVYVVSNGVHLNLFLPMRSQAMDWQRLLPASLGDTDAPMVQIGWGSRAFYTQVPTWADLTPQIAAQALFYDDAVLYVRPASIPVADAKHVRRVRMCQQELQSVSLDIAKQFANTTPVSGFHDFYPAQGHYTPFMTCNEWMRLRLQHRSMPIWSPFDQAILNHLPL